MSNSQQTRHRRRRWRVLSLVAPMCAASLMLLLKDEPEPDISDLVLPPNQVPDEQNGYLAVLSAATSFKTESSRNPGVARAVEAIESQHQPEAADLAALRSALESMTPRLEAAVALPHSVQPKLHDLGGNLTEALPVHALVHGLLADVQARSAAPAASPEIILKELALALRATANVQTAQGPMITWLTGLSQYNITLKAIPQAVGSAAFDRQNIQRLQALLRELRPTQRSFINAMRAEVELSSNSADHFRRNPRQLLETIRLSGGETANWPDWMVRLGYDHHQTIRWMAEDCRRAISLIESPTVISPTSRMSSRSPYWLGKIPNPHNFIGRATDTEDFGLKYINVMRANQALQGVTEAWLALLCYQGDRGDLPPRLDDLVPTYLDAVPVDAFDGAPLRYAPTLRAVWSIGFSGHYHPSGVPTEASSHEIDLRVPEPAPHSP